MPTDTPEEPPPQSAPETFGVTVRGWGNDATARELGARAGRLLRELSRYIDLSNLDGLTLAGDYAQALADVDRGYATTIVLTPSNDAAVGIAMTPAVIRDGKLKSHVVLNTDFAAGLLDFEGEHFPLALHLLAHEAAHVEITAAFDRCFPEVLLRSRRPDLKDQCRWDVILACWDEYAATRISAAYGADQTAAYEETFMQALLTTREVANDAIRAYRLHGDHGRIVREVYGEYGRLMKYASYHLGNLDGRAEKFEDRALSVAALEGHWFEPFLDSLRQSLRRIYETFGAWPDELKFEAIGDMVDELASLGGVHVTKSGEGLVNINVPYRPETMPI
jgi:hypothetical protein